MKVSLAHKYGFLLAGISAFVGGCVLFISLYFLDRYSTETIQSGKTHIEDLVIKQKTEDAQLILKTLSSSLDIPIYHHDFSVIYELLKPLQDNTDITYTIIHDLDGNVIHDGTKELTHYNAVFTDVIDIPLNSFTDSKVISTNDRFHFAAPIIAGGQTLAMLRVGLDFSNANQEIASIGQRFVSQEHELRNSIMAFSLFIISFLLLLSTALIFAYSRRLFMPIQRLIESCKLYSSGKKQVSFDAHTKNEFGVLGDALQEMKESIERSHEEIERLAYLDPLTELPNRRMFNEQLEKMTQWASQHSANYALYFIDLDHFKQVNDLAGHEAGDILLKETAARLASILPQVIDNMSAPVPDYLLPNLLCRLGGDEFVIIVPSFAHETALADIATLIKAELEQDFIIHDERHNVSASIGITHFPEHATDPSELVKQADIAMYVAKHAGRHRYRFYEASMNLELLEKVQVISGMREALKNGELFLVYQPIFDLDNQKVVGAEALLRWQHPTKGVINPDDFIPHIEKTELIGPLTLWVIEQASKELNRRFLPVNEHFKLSVNISTAAIKDHKVCHEINELLNASSFSKSLLHFEITETSMMENMEHCSKVLTQWKAKGADIWIDDFGTGYSSLSYLHQLPIDGLKIDRSFINDITGNHQVIETMIGLCKSMQLETISEGIESPEQETFLKEIGSRYGQGFLFSEPLVLDEIIDKIQRH